MEYRESNRQKKISSLFKKELASVFQEFIKQENKGNLILSITKVYVTPDISLAKIYISVFPSESSKKYINEIRHGSSLIKHKLSQRLKSSLRKVPELSFYLDDSLDYIEDIDRALKNPFDPIK
tara:strand:+ start:187 stop:555 length:369 start_codon:yes stop_codon:yes gene_type:complete